MEVVDLKTNPRQCGEWCYYADTTEQMNHRWQLCFAVTAGQMLSVTSPVRRGYQKYSPPRERLGKVIPRALWPWGKYFWYPLRTSVVMILSCDIAFCFSFQTFLPEFLPKLICFGIKSHSFQAHFQLSHQKFPNYEQDLQFLMGKQFFGEKISLETLTF